MFLLARKQWFPLIRILSIESVQGIHLGVSFRLMSWIPTCSMASYAPERTKRLKTLLYDSGRLKDCTLQHVS